MMMQSGVSEQQIKTQRTSNLQRVVISGTLFIQRTVATGGSQFVFFRPPLLHKFELVWAYLLLPFGLWVDGNPLGTPELKNRSYLPLFFFVTKGCLGSRPLDSIRRFSEPFLSFPFLPPSF